MSKIFILEDVVEIIGRKILSTCSKGFVDDTRDWSQSCSSVYEVFQVLWVFLEGGSGYFSCRSIFAVDKFLE